MKIKIPGMAKTTENMTKYANEYKRAVQLAANATALDVQRHAKTSIQRGEKTGKVYPPVKGVRGKPHRASAPGEAPATDTGRLVNNIHVKLNQMPTEVQANVRYADALENKMNRPFLGPALAANQKKHEERIKKAHATALNKVGRTL